MCLVFKHLYKYSILFLENEIWPNVGKCICVLCMHPWKKIFNYSLSSLNSISIYISQVIGCCSLRYKFNLTMFENLMKLFISVRYLDLRFVWKYTYPPHHIQRTRRMAFWNAAFSQIKEASQLSLNFVFLLVPIFFLEFPIQLLNFSPLNSKTISLKLKFFSFATRSNLVANKKR